jgi:hypothetical protein
MCPSVLNMCIDAHNQMKLIQSVKKTVRSHDTGAKQAACSVVSIQARQATFLKNGKIKSWH